MINYKTKQRQLLLEFFENHLDEFVSINDIVSGLSKYDISESAIYRNLNAFEGEGKIRRMSKQGDRKVYYQFIDDDECRGHIHMTCTMCGKTSHILTGISRYIINNLEKKEDFIVDSNKTIIFGVCSDCFNNIEENNGEKNEQKII
mgnify:CR=1 FL=1